MVDLPPPDGPTSAVMRPGSATNDMSRDVGSPGRYEKVDVAEFDARRR